MSIGFGFNEAQSQSGSNVWGGQAPYLTDLYGQASRLAAEQGPLADMMSANAGNVLNQANQAFGNLLTGSDTAQLNTDIQAMSQDVMRSLTEQFLPALSNSAVAAGGVGNPRASLLAGQAAGEAARGVGTISANMRNAYANRSLGALGMAPQLAGAQGIPAQTQFSPLMSLGSILGRPTVLGQSSSDAKGYSGSAGIV